MRSVRSKRRNHLRRSAVKCSWRSGMATGGAEMMDMDKVLKESHVLTAEEVIQRRTRRLEQLMKVYRAQYWGLLEEMRSKYRRFYLRHGKSGWRWDNEDGVGVSRSEQNHGEQAAAAAAAGGGGGGRELNSTSVAGEMKEPHAPEKLGNEIMRCGAQGCNNKPLLLSVYCYAHVLLEPRQRLYRPCSYVVRRSALIILGCTFCEEYVMLLLSLLSLEHVE